MRFEPFQDRILIKPTPPDEYVGGGLQLLSSDKEPKAEGIVIEVGRGVPLHEINLKVTGDVTVEAMIALKQVVELIENGRKMLAQPGDYVLYGKYAGTKQMHNGEEHIIVRESDVFGRLHPD